MHREYSGTLGSMVIQKVLAGEPATRHVTIWQYRKFVSTTPYGQISSKNLPNTRIVNPETLSQTVIDNPEFDLAEGKFLLNQPSNIGNIAFQYSTTHHILDFLRFAGLLVETGVIGDREILRFFNLRYMIIGGAELGTYPTEWWMTAYAKINRVALLFSERYGPCNTNHSYQRRALAFLQERLGSYLVIHHLAALTSDVLSYPHGYLHTVTCSADYNIGT